MIFLDELNPMVIYKKKFHLPIIENDKKKGSSVFLLTPDYLSSINLLKNPLFINNKYFISYYIEKDITYFIDNKGYLEDVTNESYVNVLNESRLLDSNVRLIEESNNNKELYFLSENNMDKKTLIPRIPDNYLTKNGFEDSKTKRVCLSTSISKCLIGLSMNCKGKYFYVHKPINNVKIKYPTTKEVPDCKITGEVWALQNVELECIGKIFVPEDDGKDGKTYVYGDNKKATLYGWKYKWLETNNESSSKVTKCTKCGSKNIGVYLQGEPIYKCNDCKKFLGVVPFHNKKSVKEGFINEGYFINKKDIEYKVDSWKNGSSNILLITGLSGSGKSTDSKQLAKEYNAIIFELDMFQHNRMMFGDNSNLSEGHKIIKELISKKYGPKGRSFNNLSNEEFEKEISVFVHELLEICKKNKNQKYIFEGLQIKRFNEKLYEEVKDYPIIIKNTSVSKSMYQRFKRDYNTSDGSFNNPYKLLKWYINSEKELNDFRDKTKKINEASDEVLNDPKRYVRSLKLKINKAKYKTNQLGDNERNNVGVSAGGTELPKGVETPTAQLPNVPMPNPNQPTNTDSNDKVKKEDSKLYVGEMYTECKIEKEYMRFRKDGQDVMIIFNENLDIFNEANSSKKNNNMLYKLLFKDRLRTNRDVFKIYDTIKTDVPYITKTFIDYNKYRSQNLFIDLSYYNQTFFNNNIYKLDKGVELYFDFIDRFINDRRLEPAGYTKKTVFVPISDWIKSDKRQDYDYKNDINPISMLIRLIRKNPNKLSAWSGLDFVFLTDKAYFKVDFSTLSTKDIPKLTLLIDKLRKGLLDDVKDDNVESKKSIVANLVSKIEDGENIKINNLTGDTENVNKDELIKKVEKAAIVSSNSDEALDKLDEDDYIKNILDTLASEEENNIKVSVSRTSRIYSLQDKFLDKKMKNKSVRELINGDDKIKELSKTELNIDTVNDEWKELQYVNFENEYDINEDIAMILNSFSTKTSPISVRDVSIEDTSTSEDYKETYSVQMEDVNGTRFTVKFDIPKFRDHKFMLLRGNDKTINGQLLLLPIIKTDLDTVQIVSNYNKIFIRRYGTSIGKSFITADKLIKVLNKNTFKGIKVIKGDNTKICNKYELPIDYIDLSSEFTKIEMQDIVIYFNQDEIRKLYQVDDKKGIPYAYDRKNNKVIYYDGYMPISNLILSHFLNKSDFMNAFESVNASSKYTYSKASILSTEIPLIIVMSYSEGLTKSLDKANIVYNIVDKRPQRDKLGLEDYIKFKDGYLVYQLDYNSSLLLNGLKECNTEDYSLMDINKRSMYLDFLDLFGGRILADGLDNFYDLMVDPITEKILLEYKLPTDYIEILAYANNLLADNKYYKHTDLNGKRYRSNEIVAGYLYKALSESYGDYKRQLKLGKKATMTMKQAKVIDNVLLDPTCSDLSSLNMLLDVEAINSVSTKGLSGMNSDRSYSLDKRTYDETMIGVLGLSTGFAGNVGITRQAAIDMNITGKRGYIKVNQNKDELGVTKMFTATEAVTPFGTTRDDPFRSAMTFIQTSKHGMRISNGVPQLISNGADMALPYLGSNTFAFKAKENGKVIEKTDDYMILQYKSGEKEFIDLRNNIKKNSNGGFYIPIKLDTNLKLGSTVKANQIVAYDKLSFSDIVGDSNDISYNLGAFGKIAILNTDEGYEDSAAISKHLSKAMSSQVVIKKEISLPKNTNIYNMVKKGQPIQEGDPLLIFQNAFDEDDVNILLKNLVDDEDEISSLGRIPIKSKVTGFVDDIKIYRTVDKAELSDSLRKKVNELEKPNVELKKVIDKHGINTNVIQTTDKLDPTGKMKNVGEGVLIEFYLRYDDEMSVGDKLIYYSALKGVVKDIFPEGKEPYTNFRPNEKIHSLLSMGSVNGRMVCSILINLGINKVLVELDRTIKTMAGIKWTDLDKL